MKINETWENMQNLCKTEAQQSELWRKYYLDETEAYKKILGAKDFNIKGTAEEIAKNSVWNFTYSRLFLTVSTLH